MRPRWVLRVIVAAALGGGLVACAGASAAPGAATPGSTAIPSLAGVDAPASTPTPVPSASVSRFDLAKTFTSSLMGYSIKVATDWAIAPATTAWTGLTDNEGTAVDAITATGTDTTVTIASQPVPAGSTFATWIGQFHDEVVAGEPPGCDGGDPSTWPAVAIGSETGTWEQLCNAAVAFAEAGGRVYVFAWESDTFDADQHLRPAEFKALLATVKFDPTQATASASPAP